MVLAGFGYCQSITFRTDYNCAKCSVRPLEACYGGGCYGYTDLLSLLQENKMETYISTKKQRTKSR